MSDDGLGEGPKDEYLHNYVASKVEAKKIYFSPRFEEITSKYWQLLRGDKGADLSAISVSKAQYVGLMKRMYKVLLPLYREAEMCKEIDQEWQQDSQGLPELNLHLFTKLLFRVAHHWAVHIDLDEYIEVLTKVYARITVRKVIKATDGSSLICYPTVYAEIVPEDENAEAFAPNTSGADEALLEPCASDEEDKDGWDYRYLEDPGSMTLKKHKKRAAPPPMPNAAADGLDMDSAPLFSVKDAIVFKEEVSFHQNSGDYKPRQDDMVSYCLADLGDVLPIGYPTEQFLTWMRNDVHIKLEEAKQGRKEALARMKREVMETGGAGREPQLKKEEDGGLVKAHGAYLEQPYALLTNSPASRVRAKAKVVDTLYNALRAVIKDTPNLQLRQHMEHPKPSLRSGATKSRAPVGGTEPTTEINKFGYNPALQRRIRYKEVPLFSKSPKPVHVNINYMYEHPDFVSAYRCDVERVENSNKLAIKADDAYQREEDFLAVDTPYKKMRHIMLVKKFETLYTENLNADENDQKRIDKIVEREEGRRKQVRTAEPLNTKGLGETFEEKSLIKMMKGPFYQHASAAGIKDDDFVTCAQQDLIDYATTPAAKVLLIGKPRSGKTMLAKKLNQKLDLVHVSVENWLAAMLEKHKKFWEEPPEEQGPPDGHEGEWVPPPVLWGTELEMAVYDALKSGGGPTHEQNVAILKESMNAPEASTKGFVLDLTYYRTQESWAKIIRSEQLLGPPDASSRMPDFSHVVELECEDPEVRLRAKHMRLDIEDVKEEGEKTLGDGQAYSRWEIADRNKVIPPKLDEEGNPIEEEEDPENPKPKKLDAMAMVQRVQDTDTFIGEELAHYNANERPALDDMLVRLYNHQYLKLDSAGLTPDELADAAAWRLRENETVPLRPIARGWPEGGPADFKACLTEPLEEPKEGEPEPLPRQWSLWRQTDPVALFSGKVVPGEPDKAVSYADSMFVFASEENMKAFQLEPKKYLQAAPQMPSSYRLMIQGPKGMGAHAQAMKLQEQYGWRVVDYPKLVRSRIEAILAEDGHLPNNVVPGKSKIGLSQSEIDEIKTGKPFPAWKFIPWILDHLGYPLGEKPDPPPAAEEEVDPETLDEEAKAEYMKQKKMKEQKEAKAAAEAAKVAKEKEEYKAKRAAAIAAGEDLEALGLSAPADDEPVTEDLSIDKLVLKPEADGKAPFVGGFILLGFPQTETHALKLKEHGVGFDRILYLMDPSEEEPGKEVKARMATQSMHYDWDAELEKAGRIIGVAREHLKQGGGEEGEEGVDVTREINATGSLEEIAVRIRLEIDPFADRCDNPDDVRDPPDPADEEAKRLPVGDFGDYCPVTYVKEGYLLKGSVEQEVQVFGKTYRLAGENEANEFKANPSKYLAAASVLPVPPPAPKIMIMGMKGSGVTTQIQKLCSKYKLEELNLKDEFLAKMKSEKEARQRRRLLERGFRPPAPADEETGVVPPDPEIEDDPEDFEKEAHERELLKLICNKDKGLIVDGTWSGFPEETVAAVDPAGFANLLYESRRAPELVVILRCEEATAFLRMIDAEATKARYEQAMKDLTEGVATAKEAERVAKLEEVTKELTEAGAGEDPPKAPEEVEKEIKDAMEAWNAEKDEADAAALEAMEYPEKPDLEEMMKEHKEKITAQQEADKEFFGDADGGLISELAQKGIPVIDDIRADTSAEFVFLKLVDRLKAHFQMRPDLIERAQAQKLTPKDLPHYELKTYIHQPSKFGPCSPISQSNPVKSRDHAVMYRERIFYLADADEQAEFLSEPSKFTKGVEPVPLDVQMVPKVSIIGLPKAGKSTLCARISALTGAVHLQMDQILEKFIDADSAQCERLRTSMKSEGRGIDDQLMVTLLAKRLKCKDCLAKGYVLEDFPKTRGQAAAMARAGVNPANVFHVRISHDEVYKRTNIAKDTDFEANRTILAKRLRYLEANMPHVAGFYQRIYNSLIEIDGFKSKWFMEDRAVTAVEANLQARQLFARAYCFRGDDGLPERPCELRDLHCDRALIKASLSQFAYFCPVTWKNTKELVKCTHNPENCVLYQNVFYYFLEQAEKEMFMNNPARFVNNVIFSSSKGIPLRLKPHKAAEIVAQEKGILGHCPVALIDEQRVVKGDLLLCSQYKETKFCFENEQNLQKFLRTPAKYNGAELPVKMPPHSDPVPLHSLQQNAESTTFMEQALGSVVTRGLREVAENRLKYPNLSVKETMLKLFAIFLKAENTANTPYMKEKYRAKMREFVERCELAEELCDLAEEKASKQAAGKWPEFKEKYYNELGAKYDEVLKQSLKEKAQGFSSYLK